jgi:two-component sensor histidine kinase
VPDQIVSDYLTVANSMRDDVLTADLLVAESNHRIANNLTLIAGLLRLQAAGIARAGEPLSATDACAQLEEAGGRIETVGRLHRLLAARGQEPWLDLGDYLRDIAEASIASMTSTSDTVLRLVSTAGRQIPTRQALPVGFIVGELVTNAVKYAHPAGVNGVIELGCHKARGGATMIRVADDGVGLPDGFDATRGGGLGMRMVRSLAGQLGARLDFVPEEIGLTVELTLPALAG